MKIDANQVRRKQWALKNKQMIETLRKVISRHIHSLTTIRNQLNGFSVVGGFAFAMSIVLGASCLAVPALGQTTKGSPVQTRPTHVEHEINGKAFRVPESYLGGFPSNWSDNTKLGTPARIESLDVAFWVSDGKPSPVRGISLNTFWPMQAGRPTSGDEDFVVHAHRIEHLSPGMRKETSVPPSKKLRNSRQYLFDPAHRTEESIYGLTCYTWIAPDIHRIVCGLDNPELDIILSSDWGSERPSNALWKMEFIAKTDGLVFLLTFPEVALRRWQDVVCRTLTLVRSWELQPDPSRSGCPLPRIASKN